MKALVTANSLFRPVNRQAKALAESFFDQLIPNDLGVPLQGQQILDRVAGCDAYITGVDFITEDVICRMPESLKVISCYGVGTDRVDLEAARRRGIAVTRTTGSNSIAVCEMAFGLMLALARNIPKIHSQVSQGQWPRYQGLELAGKTLGIVGLGAIGKLMAVRARAFGMQVLASAHHPDREFAEANGVICTDLDTLLEHADFISLHVPMRPENYHMIGREAIARMKDGAMLINTARGALVDEQAAAQALKSGKLGGLAADAFQQEPPVDSPLLGLEHVILTSHIAAHTDRALANMGMLSVQNAIAILKGEPCPYRV